MDRQTMVNTTINLNFEFSSWLAKTHRKRSASQATTSPGDHPELDGEQKPRFPLNAHLRLYPRLELSVALYD